MLLFINAAFREGSRTKALADKLLKSYDGSMITEVKLYAGHLKPLDGERLTLYNNCVKEKNFDDPLFDPAKQFAEADEIVIAAPFWNYTLPAVLHDYLELVCSQGVTFDLGTDGRYHSLCKAKKLTFITTAGGYIPENDHAFSYIKDLCEVFFDIREIRYVKADGLDVYGNDPVQILKDALR